MCFRETPFTALQQGDINDLLRVSFPVQINRVIIKEGCGKQPSYGVAGTKAMEYCAQHTPDRLVNVYNRKCRTEGCGKVASFGVTGTKTVEYCAQHAPDGMVDVKSRKCRTESCEKWPSFGVKGTRTAEYCAQHTPNGMVSVSSRECKTEGCGKQPSLGMPGTNTLEFCAQYASDSMNQRQEQSVQNGRLREEATVWSGRYENRGVLHTARTGWHGRRQEQKV